MSSRTRTHYTNSLAELISAAPAVGNEAIHESCSEKYSLVSTRRVAERLITSGWQLIGGKQGGSRIEGMQNFTRHSVLLALPHLHDEALGVQPYISFQNAHAGRGSAKTRVGLYRGACANEVMFSALVEVKFRARHMGAAEESIMDAIGLVACRMPEVLQQAREWSKFDTTLDQRVELAEAGLTARFGEDRAKWAVSLDAVIHNVRRDEDTGRDLWTSLNVIQENILRPFQKGQINEKTGKRNVFRSVSAVDTLARINSVLVRKAEDIIGLIS